MMMLTKLECRLMPNVMAALPNIGGALCWMLQFGWHTLLECHAVTLTIKENARFTRKVNFALAKFHCGATAPKNVYIVYQPRKQP